MPLRRSAGESATGRARATASGGYDTSMSKKIKKGDEVSWKFGGNTTKGKVVERFTEKVTRKIKGKKITRKASKEKPAYLVKSTDGKKALKSKKQLKKR